MYVYGSTNDTMVIYGTKVITYGYLMELSYYYVLYFIRILNMKTIVREKRTPMSNDGYDNGIEYNQRELWYQSTLCIYVYIYFNV